MVEDITIQELFDAFLVHGLAVERIANEIIAVQGMDKATLATACANQPLFSPAYCKRMYLRQLKRLLARFQFAPNNTEDLDVYMGDLKLLLQYTKRLVEAGLENCILVEFKPDKPIESTSSTRRAKRKR